MSENPKDVSDRAPAPFNTQGAANSSKEASNAFTAQNSQKRAREPSPDALRSKRSRPEVRSNFSKLSQEIANKRATEVSSMTYEKRLKFFENLLIVDQLEAALHRLSIRTLKMKDILDDSLREDVRRNLGSKTINQTLLYMAREGWLEHRSKIFTLLASEIRKKGAVRESFKFEAMAKNLESKTPTSQAQAQATNIQRSQTLEVTVKQHQDVNKVATEYIGPAQSLPIENRARILVTAREFEVYDGFAIFARVKLAALATHQSMSADFYKQLTLLALERPDLSPMALLFSFCAHSSVHQASAALISYDYLSGPLLDKLQSFSESNNIQRSVVEFLRDALQSVSRQELLVTTSRLAYDCDTTIRATRSQAYQKYDKSIPSGSSQPSTTSSIPKLPQDNKISSSKSQPVVPEPDKVVQVWQLPPHEQQLQSKLFNLHYQTDTIRCLSCGKTGHTSAACTKVFAQSKEEDSCEYCGNFGSDELQCGHLWRPTAPKMSAPVRTPSTMAMSCYKCGSSAHWGIDCNAPLGISRQ